MDAKKILEVVDRYRKHFEVNIRSAIKEDIPQLLQLLKETGLYFAPIDDHPEYYEAHLDHDPESIVVAEHEGKVVGMIFFAFSVLYTPAAHLAISPKYQRRGIGSRLFSEACKRVKERGGKYTSCYIEEDNKASLALCDSLGFETYGVKLIARYTEIF